MEVVVYYALVEKSARWVAGYFGRLGVVLFVGSWRWQIYRFVP